MANRTGHRPIGHRSGRRKLSWDDIPGIIPNEGDPTCAWENCRKAHHDGLPLCLIHSIEIREALARSDERKPVHVHRPQTARQRPKYVSYVYYLMRGPHTVKIGSTVDLPGRMHALYSEVQYVVAIEYGDRSIEHQRHQEFTEERIRSRREDFLLSDRLKAHISALQPHRDELVELAVNQPHSVIAL